MQLTITKDIEELKNLESVINRNLKSFYEVGRALMTIRDRELYKLKNGGIYNTFEAYCKETWSFTSSRARQIILATERIENIKSVTTVTHITERQTRPLARLEPEQQKEAWQKAVETAPEGKVTAAHVAKIVDQVKPKIKDKPVFEKELVSEDFQNAFDNMVIELKNAAAMNWKTTSYKCALEMIMTLLAIIENMGG